LAGLCVCCEFHYLIYESFHLWLVSRWKKLLQEASLSMNNRNRNYCILFYDELCYWQEWGYEMYAFSMMFTSVQQFNLQRAVNVLRTIAFKIIVHALHHMPSLLLSSHVQVKLRNSIPLY